MANIPTLAINIYRPLQPLELPTVRSGLREGGIQHYTWPMPGRPQPLAREQVLRRKVSLLSYQTQLRKFIPQGLLLHPLLDNEKLPHCFGFSAGLADFFLGFPCLGVAAFFFSPNAGWSRGYKAGAPAPPLPFAFASEEGVEPPEAFPAVWTVGESGGRGGATGRTPPRGDIGTLGGMG